MLDPAGCMAILGRTFILLTENINVSSLDKSHSFFVLVCPAFIVFISELNLPLSFLLLSFSICCHNINLVLCTDVLSVQRRVTRTLNPVSYLVSLFSPCPIDSSLRLRLHLRLDWSGVELRLNSKETGQMVASTEVKFYNCSVHHT